MRKQFTVIKRLHMQVVRKRIGNHEITETIPAAVLLDTGERCDTRRLRFIGEDKHGRPLVIKKRTKARKYRAWIDRGKSSHVI